MPYIRILDWRMFQLHTQVFLGYELEKLQTLQKTYIPSMPDRTDPGILKFLTVLKVVNLVMVYIYFFNRKEMLMVNTHTPTQIVALNVRILYASIPWSLCLVFL